VSKKKPSGSERDSVRTPTRTPKRTPNPRSLRNLRPPWQPGQPSPNPGGRPVTKPITSLYLAQLNKAVDGDTLKRTYGELFVEGQFRAAIRGDTAAAKEITDRLEGKAMQPVELAGSEGSPLNFKLNIRFRDVTRKNL